MATRGDATPAKRLTAIKTGLLGLLGAATRMVFILVYAFNILSDGLQDAFDPKHVK